MMELNLELLKTVGGAVFFVELVLQGLYKPFIKNFNLNGWEELATNIVAFLVALIGAEGAGYLLGGFMPADVANLALVALVASSIATYGYEAIKNLAGGARANLP